MIDRQTTFAIAPLAPRQELDRRKWLNDAAAIVKGVRHLDDNQRNGINRMARDMCHENSIHKTVPASQFVADAIRLGMWI